MTGSLDTSAKPGEADGIDINWLAYLAWPSSWCTVVSKSARLFPSLNSCTSTDMQGFMNLSVSGKLSEP